MPVFDFSDAPDKKNPAECTYTTFQSSEPEASPEKPILILGYVFPEDYEELL